MDAFNPEMIKLNMDEMEQRAAHHRLVKTARANCVSWLRRTVEQVWHGFALQRTERREARQAKAWETAELVVVRNPQMTTGKC